MRIKKKWVKIKLMKVPYHKLSTKFINVLWSSDKNLLKIALHNTSSDSLDIQTTDPHEQTNYECLQRHFYYDIFR